jgi:hypothetical protein
LGRKREIEKLLRRHQRRVGAGFVIPRNAIFADQPVYSLGGPPKGLGVAVGVNVKLPPASTNFWKGDLRASRCSCVSGISGGCSGAAAGAAEGVADGACSGLARCTNAPLDLGLPFVQIAIAVVTLPYKRDVPRAI